MHEANHDAGVNFNPSPPPLSIKSVELLQTEIYKLFNLHLHTQTHAHTHSHCTCCPLQALRLNQLQKRRHLHLAELARKLLWRVLSGLTAQLAAEAWTAI